MYKKKEIMKMNKMWYFQVAEFLDVCKAAFDSSDNLSNFEGISTS